MFRSNAMLPLRFLTVRHGAMMLWGLCFLAVPAFGQTNLPVQRVPTDVSLGPAGMLVGSYTDVAGRPLPTARFDLHRGGQYLQQVVTDNRGRFRVANLQPGNYEIPAAGGQPFRVWPTSCAPPHAAGQPQTAAFQVVGGGECAYSGSYATSATPSYGYAYGGDGFGGYIPSGSDRVFARFPALKALGVVASVALPIALGGSDDGVTIALPPPNDPNAS